MKKLTVFLMSIVFLAFMGLSVSATSDEPTPVDTTDPIVTEPVDGVLVNPCGDNVEVCALSSGETGTVTEVKVCTVDEQGNEVCEIVLTDTTAPDWENADPIDNTVDETPVDCEKDPTVCQRTDGNNEDGIYYMTTAENESVKQDTSMVTVSVVASTMGLIFLGIAANRKLKKN